MSEVETTRVLYVVGSARSGSTILDTLLGSPSGVASVGELTNLVQFGWMNRELCACGEAGDKCAFWVGVREAWHARVPGLNEAEYVKRARSWERILGWLTRVNSLRPGLARYQRETAALYQSIAELAQVEMVVDSSKIPGRALALAGAPDLDMRYLHLVRDGRGVAWSLRKAFEKNLEAGVQHDIKPLPLASIARRWALVNSLAERVVRQANSQHAVRARYEDLMQDPLTFFAAVSAMSEFDYSNVAQQVVDGAAFAADHAIAGNRVRMAGPVRLKHDRAWESGFSAEELQTFESRARRWLRRYGYLN